VKKKEAQPKREIFFGSFLKKRRQGKTSQKNEEQYCIGILKRRNSISTQGTHVLDGRGANLLEGWGKRPVLGGRSWEGDLGAAKSIGTLRNKGDAQNKR